MDKKDKLGQLLVSTHTKTTGVANVATPRPAGGWQAGTLTVAWLNRVPVGSAVEAAAGRRPR